MSGGSYDYAYARIEALADQITEAAEDSELRLRFADHLRLVAKAARSIEWVDSGDYALGGEIEDIEKVLA